MLSGKHLLIALCFFILILNSSADAVPALNGGPEPEYPPGTNTPSQQALNRDDADLQGEWNCLVILIDFEDYPWDNQDDELFENDGNPFTEEHFEAMLFSDLEFAHPGSESQYTGSMRDYYNEISREDFTVTGVVTEWYRAPRPYSYYCNADGEFGTDDDYGWDFYPRNVQGLAEQAILAAADDVNFSDFDNTGDGQVDALFIIHAGPGAELFGHNAVGASYIWSHKWSIREFIWLDGVLIGEYAMQPQSGAISVFCHEFGHLLGLPDLYDIDYSTQGIGEWGLMGKGTWCHREGDTPGSSPSHMCAYSKKQFDWVDIIDVTEAMWNVEIPPIEESGIAYRVFPMGDDDSPEYFLLENRRRIGFDAGLTRRQTIHGLAEPEGLLITHIDERQEREDNQDNTDENHRLVDVEEASVIWIDGEPVEHLDVQHNNDWLNLHLGNRGDNGDLWPGFNELTEDSTDWTGGRARLEFGTNSVPSTILYNGRPSRIQISEIQFYRNYNVTCNIQVDDRGPCLIVNQWSVYDDEGGNGNRLIEPGETIDLRIELKNIGEDPATAVNAILGYEGNLIEVLTDSSIFADIENGETATSEIMFQLRIPEDIPQLRPVELSLAVSSAEEEWELPLTIQLQKFTHNPVFSSDPVAWDSLAVSSPSVIVENDTLKCWYVGRRGLDRSNYTSIGFAYSLDGGITWRKRDEPILEADPNVEHMQYGFTDVAVIRLDDM
ncbi:MAG: M6 family metalloprotease domain-containing protein [Calditrichaeota bacterium]|nr:M6 family metalloprotease domain-containing protein [Calditrichota bacterium]